MKPFLYSPCNVSAASVRQAIYRSAAVAAAGKQIGLAAVLVGLAACNPSKPEGTASTVPAEPAGASAPSTALGQTPGQSPDGGAGGAPASPSANPSAGLPNDTLDQILNAPAVNLTLPEVVALVEGQEIKKQELEQALATVLAGQGITPDQLPAAQKAEGYRMLLDELIVSKLLTKHSAGEDVKEEQVNARFDEIKGRFPSPEAFTTQLEKSGQSAEKLKADIQDSLKKQQWVENQVKDAPKATDEEVEDFYKKNPQQFQKPEQVRASHILVSLAKDAAAEAVTEKQKKAEEILARIKAGEAFDKLAKELSEDPSAKDNAGDLNFFTREQMLPEFSEAAFGMKKGDLSSPVRSQFGFHIIQVTDRKEAEVLALDTVKPQLTAFLNRQKHDGEVRRVLKDLRDKSSVEVKLP